MDMLLSLFYILFTICVVYPPSEFVSAGFTIPQLFDGVLGSENVNFVEYHIKRISLTIFIQSFLPLGYVICLWFSGISSYWLLLAGVVSAFIPLAAMWKINSWWQNNKKLHPVVLALKPYIPEDGDWKSVATTLNTEFRSVDKVSIPLSVWSKFVATESWLVLVGQYQLHFAKQEDAALVATDTDIQNLNLAGDDEVQYVTVSVIPSRENVLRFKFRLPTASLREMQPRLSHPIIVPGHLNLQATLIEKFVIVFKQHVQMNPAFVTDQVMEACIGCMQAPADVKLQRNCSPTSAVEGDNCQECRCRVLWCCGCMGRWWATRAPTASEEWLSARGSCPLCRATFCMLDVCPAVTI